LGQLSEDFEHAPYDITVSVIQVCESCAFGTFWTCDRDHRPGEPYPEYYHASESCRCGLRALAGHLWHELLLVPGGVLHVAS
jgi:hypothetical protein